MEGEFSSDLNVGPARGHGLSWATIDEARVTNSIIMPIQFIGIICNVIVLWVWSAERVYVSSTYLFKALAVSDILFLLFNFCFSVFWYPGYTHDKVLFGAVFFSIMAFGNNKNSLLIILVLATSRVIKAFFPLHARRLLVKSRMRIVLICCLIYSIGLQTIIDTLLVYFPRNSPTAIKLKPFMWSVMGHALPASLQIVLMLAVACKVLRQRAILAPLVVDLLSRQRSEENSKTKVGKDPYFPILTDSRQFVHVVFAICFTSFLTYVLPASTIFLIKKNDQAKRKAIVIAVVLSSINSSVNIIFYMLIHRFRYLFADNTVRLLQKVGVSTTFTTSPELVEAAGTRNTGGEDGEGDGERTETDQEEGIAETDNNLPDPPSLKSLDKKGDSTCTP
ncbi:hypothetical protein V1264_003546 [Littorina saxatilis]|uniref:G-protein coupled receptors family 1 profile domain-containing protein n=1 Tax=Littorina saxatilis TaxID=31220 RepID=A0AAN9B5Z8_9CAEN